MADNQNLALDIDEAATPKDSEGSAQPDLLRVYVELACSYLRGGGAPTLTVDCATIEEFEGEIGRLKAECDAVLEQARAHFGTAPRRTTQPAYGATKTVRPGGGDSSVKGENTKNMLDYLQRELRVADCMTRDVKTVQRNAKLAVADELMKVGGFRHVVVVEENGEIAGVISQRDIFYGALSWSMGQGELAHERTLNTTSAKQVMRSDVRTISPLASLPEAARIMREDRIGCLPVAEDGRLVGIITEGDFLSLLADYLPPLIGATLDR